MAVPHERSDYRDPLRGLNRLELILDADEGGDVRLLIVAPHCSLETPKY